MHISSSRNTLIKKILGLILILGCSGIFFNGYVGMGEQAYAQQGGAITPVETATGNTGSSMDTTSIRQMLNVFLKLMYLLLWPLLVVAGLALDNTLVYASVFHLDAPLWKFWNMMKNFANFALGFMVLFAIIKSLFTNSGQGSFKDEKSPLGIIKMTLIAGILIQASRFLLAALIDISTISTYAVGGLPLSVLKNTPIGNQKILAVNSSIDLNKFEINSAGGEDFQIRYSTKHSSKTITISPCRVERSYVIGREYGDPRYKNTDIIQDLADKDGKASFAGLELCAYNGNTLVLWAEDALMEAINNDPGHDNTSIDRNTKAGYKAVIERLLNITGWDSKEEFTQHMVYLGSGDDAMGFILGKSFFEGTDSITISDLINKSKGFVGPLVTIYSSLLNFSQLTDTNITNVSGTSGIFIIKSLVAIALFFPLLALAIVLIMRIGILRLYVVASPFIVLKESFKNAMPKFMDEYLSIKGVMGIVFAPVVTVAALSLSLIFMTALVNGFNGVNTDAAIKESLGIQSITPIEKNNEAVSILGVSQLEISKLPGALGGRFSRFMVNFFAIGLMWMIFFAALKANALGKFVEEKVGIEGFGKNFIKTLPIVPFPGGKVGLGSMASVLKGASDQWIRNKESQQRSIASDFVFGPSEGGTGSGTTAPTTISTTDLSKFITVGAKADTIKSEVQKLGVKDTDIGTVLGNSTINLYEAINTLNNPTATEKTSLIQAIQTAGGLPVDWYDKAEKEAAKIALEKIIIIPDKNTPKETIENLIKNNTDKVQKYFKTPGITEYTKTIDGTTFTIKPNTTNTYDVTITT